MAGPAIRDLALYRGDDYAHEITFTDAADPPEPMDLTGYTFLAQIRDRPENSSVVRATFTIDTSEAVDGKIVLHLNAASTRIPQGFWDLEVNDGTTTRTWLKGMVHVSGDVTQEVTP